MYANDFFSSLKSRLITALQIRIRIKVKIQELLKLTMQPQRAVDSNNWGVEAQNGVIWGLLTSERRFASL
jgi:hypothetical protein